MATETEKAAVHTPGPWKIDPKTSTRIVGAGDRGIASAGGYFNNQDSAAVYAENEANARLISAAPDLLAAARALFDAPHYDHFATRLNDAEMAALDALRAAVAKAEGRTP